MDWEAMNQHCGLSKTTIINGKEEQEQDSTTTRRAFRLLKNIACEYNVVVQTDLSTTTETATKLLSMTEKLRKIRWILAPKRLQKAYESTRQLFINTLEDPEVGEGNLFSLSPMSRLSISYYSGRT